MVNFCFKCDTSLPYAVTIISKGREIIAPDQICPFCKQPASELAYSSAPVQNMPDEDTSLNSLTENTELVINQGQASLIRKT